MTKEKWKTLLNLFVTIITAIAATLTTQGCMRCSAAAPAAPRERMNACRMRGALLPSAPHDNTRQHERVFCYIVTLLHCYIKVVSQCSLYAVNSSFGFTTREPMQQCLRELRAEQCLREPRAESQQLPSPGLNNVCVSQSGLKAQQLPSPGQAKRRPGLGQANVATPCKGKSIEQA